ncbi:MAG: tyrosine-protein phosphatase, partial [Oscillospiraceae bacterium]|nr:tyrosine-protein phosphatase [Oscillospiraceae bacterium]
MENVIFLPGVSNVRELGGYPVGNRFVRKGVLIRSGTLADAGSEAIQTLIETYHVQAVIDFRMRDKRTGSPDPEIAGATQYSLPVAEMEDFAAVAGNPDMAGLYREKSTDRNAIFESAYEHGLLGPEIYTVFLFGKRGREAYRRFFQILLKTDPDRGAVLWHCDDGKDRAGLATMLLLSALGADQKTIISDYLMTNESNAPVIEAIRREYSSRQIPQDKLNAMIFASGGVFEHYLRHAFDAVDRKYGGVTGYLRKELELTDADIEALREKYTDRGA